MQVQKVEHLDTLVGRIYHCMTTVHAMLADRGYSVESQMPQYDEMLLHLLMLDMADSERSQALMNQYELKATRETDDSFLIVKYLCGKVGVKTDSMQKVKDLFPALRDKESAIKHKVVEKQPDVVMLVQLEGCNITAPAQKECAKFPAVVEVFNYKQLLRNITKHEYQPKFRVMSELEKEEVKRKYICSDDQLPKMLWEDPIRQYFGLKEGQMISCTRLADVGKEPYYRIVQPPSVSKKKK